MRQLRERKTFTKPSVARRAVIQKHNTSKNFAIKKRSKPLIKEQNYCTEHEFLLTCVRGFSFAYVLSFYQLHKIGETIFSTHPERISKRP